MHRLHLITGKKEIAIIEEDGDEFLKKVCSQLKINIGELGKLQDFSRVSKKENFQMYCGPIHNMKKLPRDIRTKIESFIIKANKRNRVVAA